MEIKITVKGVERCFQVRSLEVRMAPSLFPRKLGSWELVARTTEVGAVMPMEEKLLILGSNPKLEPVEMMKCLIEKHGGIASDEEYLQITRELSLSERLYHFR